MSMSALSIVVIVLFAVLILCIGIVGIYLVSDYMSRTTIEDMTGTYQKSLEAIQRGK
jgi:multisubunit Na+/H+ antiporter MnhG subunit